MNLTLWARKINEANVEKGFWPEGRNLGEVCALIHSEVSELLEYLRKGGVNQFCDKQIEMPCDFVNESGKHPARQMKGVEEELADIIIRCLDFAGHLDIDIQLAIEQKLAYNSSRPHKHGKKF